MAESNDTTGLGELEGRTKLAEGREAEIFEWDGGSVLRLLREVGAGEQLEYESLAMVAARAAGVRCPEPRGVIEVAGRAGLVLERIDGVDGLDNLATRPWRLWGAAKAFGDEHARLGLTEAPAGLRSMHESLRHRIGQADVSEAVRTQALEELRALPDGDRICHGDFHPGNLIWAPDGPVVIDWVGAVHGDPVADHARTLLLLRTGSLPPGTPLVLKAMAKVARSVLIRGYRHAYNSLLPIDSSELARWELPVAVARIGEGFGEEREALDRQIAELMQR